MLAPGAGPSSGAGSSSRTSRAAPREAGLVQMIVDRQRTSHREGRRRLARHRPLLARCECGTRRNARRPATRSPRQIRDQRNTTDASGHQSVSGATTASPAATGYQRRDGRITRAAPRPAGSAVVRASSARDAFEFEFRRDHDAVPQHGWRRGVFTSSGVTYSRPSTRPRLGADLEQGDAGARRGAERQGRGIARGAHQGGDVLAPAPARPAPVAPRFRSAASPSASSTGRCRTSRLERNRSHRARGASTPLSTAACWDSAGVLLIRKRSSSASGRG